MTLETKNNAEDASALERNEFTSSTLPMVPDFPEGGTSGWVTLFGATLTQFVTFGYTNAFGVYQDFYVREYLTSSTPSDIGWIGGAQILLIFSSGIISGKLFDRGYFYHLMISGSLLHVFSLFMLSLSRKNSFYQVFLSQGISFGLSTGMCYLPSLAVISHYFHHRRPVAMGVISGGAALGATVYPIVLNKFFHGSLGFHNGVRVTAGINLMLLIVANLCMRTRLAPRKNGNNHALLFFRDPPYVLVLLGSIMVFFGLFFPPFYIQLNAVSHGVDRNFAFYSVSILNGASLVGRVVPGFFAPRYGVFNLVAFFGVTSGGIVLSMIFVKDLVGTALFAVFVGFFTGGAIGLNAPMLGSLAKDVTEIGARIGINFTFCGIVGLFASPITGALLTNEFHWTRPIVFSGVCLIAGGCFQFSARCFLARQKGTQLL